MFVGDQGWGGAGCEKCGNAGMRGRVGFYEVILTTPAMRQAIAQGASAFELGRHVQAGFITMRRDGVMKAASGMTTLEEVLRATQDADERVGDAGGGAR
jgi:type II secretory ATPase GspE/PulE/Tfp pilus assembly ATPase PilB-like protein